MSCLQGEGVLLSKATPFILEKFPEKTSAAKDLQPALPSGVRMSATDIQGNLDDTP